MRRISVVGTSGSGKSTLAGKLSTILGVPYLELDGIYHQPGWTPLPKEDYRRVVATRTAGDGWVVDGNYSTVRPIVWAQADTVIWLDLPRSTVMRQLTWRTLRRVGRRTELWNGNRERWQNFFSWNPEESVICYAWHTHAEYRELYAAAAIDPANAHLKFIRLTSRGDIARFLAETRAQQADRTQSASGQA